MRRIQSMALDPEEKRVEELLLRCARLDLPQKKAKQRAIDAGLVELGKRLPSTSSGVGAPPFRSRAT